MRAVVEIWLKSLIDEFTLGGLHSALILLPNFDFYLCLRVKFHESSFWVLILAAGGPYWVLISQKNGSLSQSLGVLFSFRGSAMGQGWLR